jgi:hypothetical protein
MIHNLGVHSLHCFLSCMHSEHRSHVGRYHNEAQLRMSNFTLPIKLHDFLELDCRIVRVNACACFRIESNFLKAVERLMYENTRDSDAS